jgi:cytochrome c556
LARHGEAVGSLRSGGGIAAAVEAAGEDGPADVEAFRTAMNPVLGTCKECHETYRIDN